MQRRTFLKNGTVLLGVLPLISTNEYLNLITNVNMEDGIVKLKIGKFNCTIFRDLSFKYLAKDYFINANPEELNLALNKYHIQPDNIPSPFIAMLLESEDKKILIDTGIGYLDKPVEFRGASYLFKGQLINLLQKAGIKNESITDVIITHFHPDHVGGIYSEVGGLNFTKATFHVHTNEWDYWHTTKSDQQPALFKYFIQKHITPLKALDLNLIKGDFVSVLPGITAVLAAGHTPGQIALVIESEKESLLYISDAFLHPLHIEKLDWQTSYDLDHEVARQSRVKLIELAYKEQMRVNAFHFTFPGLGRIEKVGNNWKWNSDK